MATPTLLSAEERHLRALTSGEARAGRDPTRFRLLFAEAQANRELRQAAERMVAAREAQGLEPRITDPATLAVIASLLTPEAGRGDQTTPAPASGRQKSVVTVKSRPGDLTRTAHAGGGDGRHAPAQ